MKKRYILKNLGCANCAAKMEDKISKIDGVSEVSINFFTTKMSIEFDETKESQILKKAQAIITKIEPYTKIEI
ncbi:heavy-metal-associated domain-containing protein [Campylobacter sp. FMV-PI01]|uniref:Heavy-metal-associated domain-containing protein n=1 Tax=Campylobacter portucalensis TaxID=2608384 RepID=A0A6L5WJ25_9BACT|nr:heavy-metal-associated domain-containing protein [Campylobacter portucalensis]